MKEREEGREIKIQDSGSASKELRKTKFHLPITMKQWSMRWVPGEIQVKANSWYAFEIQVGC